MSYNPYQAPRATLVPTPRVQEVARNTSELAEAELRTFIGWNAGFYLDRWNLWSVRLGGKIQANGFNFAGLLPAFWFPFRKMYRATLILYGSIAAATFLLTWLFILGIVPNLWFLAPHRLPSIMAGIICGCFGNAWYLTHARRKISQVQALGLGEKERAEERARSGGTNVLAALGLSALYVITIIIAISAGATASGRVSYIRIPFP